MPTLPPAQCAAYHCKAPSRPGSIYCLDHAPLSKAPNARRTLDSLYRTAAWQTIRTGQLSREPLCSCCAYEGRLTVADAVDHVFPWKLIGDHAFRANRWQSLCASCHTRKTSLEGRGIFRHYTATAYTDYTLADYPNALDS